MPSSAATFFGLVLIALSIGFNTMRWPIVGQMVGPAAEAAPLGETASSPATPPEQPAKPPAAEPASPAQPAPAAAAAAVIPVPDVERAAAADLLPAQTEPPAEAASAPSANPPPAPTTQERRLVPVPRLRDSSASAAGRPYDGTVRRLPPVDPNELPPLAGNRPPADGATPIYPSTGIE
jgi:hypothetical protein